MRKTLYLINYLVVAISILSAVHAHAQTAERVLIKGRITDSRDKLPVVGATVVEQDKDKRTITGVATDIDGNFAIKVSDVTHKLSISIIGYKTKILDIGTRRIFNTTLESNANSLSEVTVSARSQVNNGSGLTIDTRDKTTSTFTLNAKDVEELQATTIDQAIQGRVPGMDIVSNSGDPGAGMQIKIRGTSTINGATNPLIVVDGVPFETSVPSSFNFATADNTQYADLLSIAPSDIRDISILKDAAATAVWGSRAANGVLIINTKRGTRGAPTISYTFKGTTTQQPSGIPLLTGDQYSTFIPEMVMNVTGAPLNTFTNKEFEYDPSNLYYYKNYSQNTDWIKAISRRGNVLDNNLSISGGGEKARYFASVGYNNQVGTTVGTGLNRLNTRLNLDYIVSDRIRFTTFVSYAHTNTQYNYAASNNGTGSDGVRSIAAIRAPNGSIYEYNEFGILTPNYFTPASNVQGQYPATYNPVAMANSAINTLVNDRITPHFYIQYNVVPGILNATSDVVFDINNGKQNRFLPQQATGRPYTETNVNRASISDYDTYNIATKSNLVYTPKLNPKHSFTGLLSIQTNDVRSLTQGQLATNTASDQLQDPASPGRLTSDGAIFSSISQYRTASALINGQYKLLDRYIINAALRGDGSSRFGSSKRYGLFPSVSARWRISGEPFMKGTESWLDDLSLRGGYGESGSAPNGDYLFYNNYVNTTTNYLGQSGLYPNNIQLDNLKWENLQGMDAGINIIMFKNRLNVDFGVYRNRTKDLLTTINLSSFNGYNSVLLNAGTLDNQGFELSIFSTPYKSKDLIIDFNFNIATNVNALRSVSPYYPTQTGNTNTNGSYLSLLQVNNPLGSFYGYKFKGVYKDADATIARDANGNKILSPDGRPVQMRFNYPATDYQFQAGDSMYEDINHDGNINYQDVVYLGNGTPKFTGGFGPTFTIKGNLKIQAFFNFRTGGQIINGTKMSTTSMYGFNNQSTAVLRRWRVPGDETDMPRALYRAGYNWLGSDRYVEDGTFLRFRSVTARYTFNKALARRLKTKNLSMYLTAENLLTFTKYTGQDPEVSTRGEGITQQTVDYSTTPPLKQFTLGLTASF
ncbi:SusC/RagA family TonB-linked outer membrane protein [Mucilaginibacter daejeonensis]|uniref:SusC/RagA family TonB-linked outer membrane protein n=1 Tax=Mucilaginibacter daejeonensis TaxID=398049 RepID=UPI001D174ED3|nr:SusC/RagA family TonB-linked outer membrane protein [Mucilaginibacter daejeonensis]UEG54995.1 SusC/RagA family TonB-linked outer membrane protein [Mucilaginibacter daejeonensis]